MKKLVTLFTIFYTTINLVAQTTAIPDSNFEQALIDLGIDSDGIINGQVFTMDIEDVEILDVSERGIQDLTGIEGFAALEELNASYNFLVTLDMSDNINLKKLTLIDLQHLTSINISNNINLKELILGNNNEQHESNIIQHIDLSNNNALEKLWLTEMPSLKYINLTNNDHSLLTDVYIDCIIEGADCGNPPCMEVDDIEAIDFSIFPYNLWFANVTFAEDCLLNISEVEKKTLVIYPNPANDIIHIKMSLDFEIEKTELFDINGKLIIQYTGQEHSLDISNIANGQYFLKFITNNGIMIKKLVVKK